MRLILLENIGPRWSVAATSVLVIALWSAASRLEAGVTDPVRGSTFPLDALVAQTAILQTPNGEMTFDRFSFDVTLPNDYAPTAAEITVTADFDMPANRSTLLFDIEGTSRLLRPGESYSLAIEYDAVSRLPAMALASAVLDIGGATTGTNGDARVHIDEQLRRAGDPLLALNVWDAPPEPSRLIDSGLFSALTRRASVETRIDMNGGVQAGSAALLTDYTQQFTLAEVPEPASLVLASWLAALLLIGNRCRWEE